MKNLDGQTSGPTSFSGPIGSALKNCENYPVVEFQPVSTILSADNIELKLLSSDQKYLLEISCAVSEGVCPEGLARRRPGKMAHSRWLTFACRLLRYYITVENPDENLIVLVNFVQKVYAPTWFLIKRNHSIQDGAKNLWQMINWSRYLPENLRQVVDPVIQRNGYYGHPENILIAMIADERAEVRRQAWKKIADIRKSHPTSDPVRTFQVPPLNFNATDYTQLVNWDETVFSEPPVIMELSDDDIESFVEECSPFKLSFPCHTQAVERMVKEVTQVSKHVAKEEERHFYISKRLESRKKMPTFETKSQFCL